MKYKILELVGWNCTTKIKSEKLLVSILLFISFVVAFSVLSKFSLADSDPPILFDSIPQNNSYVRGGVSVFSVNVTEENLNVSTVKLYMKAQDEISWETYSLDCYGIGSDWLCNKTVSFKIVGSDTVEMFYFEAYDTYGNYGSLGSASEPLYVTIDRTPPKIEFIFPKNESYVSGVLNVTLSVTDASSGVNHSSVGFSLDNETWESMNKDEYNGYYRGELDVTTFSNNETITIYAKATDNISNINYSSINVSIDNELPSIFILQPSADDVVIGTILLKIEVRDSYSGVDTSYVSYEVGGLLRFMDCSGEYISDCEKYFNTLSVSDGEHEIKFTAEDLAGNTNSTSVNVTVDNKIAKVSIINPSDGSYVYGLVNITANLEYPEKLSGVKIKINSEWEDMNCDGSVCFYLWNTSATSEGSYTIYANATHNLEYSVNDSVSVVVDNTPPKLLIDSPVETVVNDTIYPKVIVTDEYGVDEATIKFIIGNYTKTMLCSKYVQGKKYVCSENFDTTKLSEAYYGLIFYAKDLAGNENSTSKLLLIDNEEGVGPLPNETTTPTISGSEETTTTIISTTTTTTKPTTISNPIVVLFWDVQKAIGDILKPWPIKALAISMIIFLIVLAIFRIARAKHLLEKEENKI